MGVDAATFCLPGSRPWGHVRDRLGRCWVERDRTLRPRIGIKTRLVREGAPTELKSIARSFSMAEDSRKLFVAGLPDSNLRRRSSTAVRGHRRHRRRSEPPQGPRDRKATRVRVRDAGDHGGSQRRARVPRRVVPGRQVDLRAAVPGRASSTRRRAAGRGSSRARRAAQRGRRLRWRRPGRRARSHALRRQPPLRRHPGRGGGAHHGHGRRARRARPSPDGPRRSQARLRLRHHVQRRHGQGCDRGPPRRRHPRPSPRRQPGAPQGRAPRRR